VAIIDTGVQADLPELVGRVVPGADLIGNGTDGRTDFDGEAFSHGTAMASIIVARAGYGNIVGVAPGAKILPIAVPLRGVVRRGVPTPDATAVAVRYAAEHGAKIISMSLGGLRYQGQDDVPCPQTLQAAILDAVAAGALVVAASGNSGENGSPVEEPGVCLGAISVGSVNSTLTASTFSSRHPYLTLSAPGDEVPTLTRVPGRAFVGGGTSQATAMASAALAVVWSKFPTDTGRQVLTRVLETATDRGARGTDPVYGAGVVNPGAAIAAPPSTAGPTAANPVFDGVEPLLAQRAASPVTPAVTGPAGDPAAALGDFVVGRLPSVFGAAFYGLVGAALLALLATVALVVAAARRRPRPVLATPADRAGGHRHSEAGARFSSGAGFNSGAGFSGSEPPDSEH
jgi:subtilisin family serine protease